MVYVITAVHNRYNITENFVNQLKKQTCSDLQLVLVDDGCTDGTSEMVTSVMPNAVILKGDGNLWWGGAMHLAYKWIKDNAKDDAYVVFMNDDTYFEKDFIETGISLIKENPQCLITGCGFSINSGKQLDGAVMFHSEDGTYKRLKGDAEGNCASTRALIMSVKTMKKIGGFHPVLLPHYASDYEYTIRAGRKGFKIKAFESFNYKFDEGTTGNHDTKKVTLKKLFSKRSSFNPFYRFNFIFMVTPVKHLPSHILSQMKRYKKQLSSRG